MFYVKKNLLSLPPKPLIIIVFAYRHKTGLPALTLPNDVNSEHFGCPMPLAPLTFCPISISSSLRDGFEYAKRTRS